MNKKIRFSKDIYTAMFLIILIPFAVVVYATVFNESFDISTPVGTESPTLADNRMREIKAATQERMNVDHHWPLDGNTVDNPFDGEHDKITFFRQQADPTVVGGKAYLYMKSDELYWKDDSNVALRITNDGNLKSTAGLTVDGVTTLTGTTNAARINLTGILNPTVYAATFGGFRQSNVAEWNSDASTDKVVSQLSIKTYVGSVTGSANYSPTAMTGGDDSNGTITLPNGLIIKWGKQVLDGTTSITNTTVTTGFTTACFQAIAIGGDATETSFDFQIQVHTITAASFKIRARIPNRNSPCHWIAIGR